MLDGRITHRYAALGHPFHQRVSPTPFAHSRLVTYSPAAAQLLELTDTALQDNNFIQTFSGNDAVKGFEVICSVYSGHQFGHYVPQLGDGRAHLIAELDIATSGYWEVQLKGSGKTPYSRFGDGRAVLRSCIREFLASEAMAALGIPTTRALCIIGSDELVQRETLEQAAMMTRLSPSHLRFGHFEYFSHTQQYDALRMLVDFTIAHYFPQAQNAEHPYAAWFSEVVQRTARLIAQWQCIGFCHGVMNTDNMSILGLTLDYGPFGFMEGCNIHHICNHSDEHGRYAYSQQPAIGYWNLNALAYALSPLISDAALKDALRSYKTTYLAAFEEGMRAKLGLEIPQENDADFVKYTLQVLHENRIDYSIFFRSISADTSHKELDKIPEWLTHYHARLSHEKRDSAARYAAMQAVNPRYILRNYLAEQAIRAAEQGDYREVETLHHLLSQPYDDQPEYAAYAAPPPDWASGIAVSCSS